eukprot:COSAG01_NODE_44647_length_416_cov_193.854890_1_plen_40_part_01
MTATVMTAPVRLVGDQDKSKRSGLNTPLEELFHVLALNHA